MTETLSPPWHDRDPSAPAVEPFDDILPAEEFEVTIVVDEGGDADRFHITSIGPRPRR